MKTYKEDIGIIMANLKDNQQVFLGTSHPIFILVLIHMAKKNPEREYLIPYDGNKAKDGNRQIIDLAEMYSKFTFPDNILFEETFAAMIQEFKQAVSN